MYVRAMAVRGIQLTEIPPVKSGTAKIVTRLTELQAQCRIVVTGTPLNNTVREILNLLHFLDPVEWKNLDEEEARYAVPDEQTFQELRTRIAPYMLRRKNDVLKLKPKVSRAFCLAEPRLVSSLTVRNP